MISGVYAIQCVTNGKYYIGQSKDIYGRLRKNKPVKGMHFQLSKI
jgi:predicted GIY-YIG superfamily endonuclease